MINSGPRTVSAFLLLFLLGALAEPAPAAAQPLSSWPSAQAANAELAAQFPQSAALQRRLLGAALEANDDAAIRAGLQRLATLGYAPTNSTLDLVASHVPAAEMTALRQRFSSNFARVEASALLFLVPPEQRLVEGIAWDGRDQRLFLGTVVGRALVVHDARGWRTVDGLDAGSLFGLAADRRSGGRWRLLWAASGRLEQTPAPATAFRGLIAIDRDTLREVRRVSAPEGVSPGDVAISARGHLYASDPQGGGLYEARPGDRELRVLVPPGRFINPQAMVPTDDGRWLYVADYICGLALVDLWHHTVVPIRSDVDTMLDGIDGLYAFRGGLIATQNGTRPHRILFLRRSPDHRRIVSVRVLESNNEAWNGEPTLGVVRGGDFLYVADSQWDRYDAGGAVVGEGALRPTQIRLIRP